MPPRADLLPGTLDVLAARWLADQCVKAYSRTLIPTAYPIGEKR
jgi:hypothetical protein